MSWNWQLPDWPNFRFDADRIRAQEEQFLKGSGVVIGSLHHLDADERDGLTIELMSQKSIHPFEDGNGRIGRAITEKALA